MFVFLLNFIYFYIFCPVFSDVVSVIRSLQMLTRNLVQIFSLDLSHFAPYPHVYNVVHVSNTCRWLDVAAATASRVSFFHTFKFYFCLTLYLSIFLYCVRLSFFLPTFLPFLFPSFLLCHIRYFYTYFQYWRGVFFFRRFIPVVYK